LSVTLFEAGLLADVKLDEKKRLNIELVTLFEAGLLADVKLEEKKRL
jgi:hypothetical protein